MNLIISNNSSEVGGGIACRSNSSPNISNVKISSNHAKSLYGGGIYCYNKSLLLLDSVTIINNDSDDDGGGISCFDSSKIILRNSKIITNECRDEGGGVYLLYSTLEIDNCQIIGNTCGLGGGIFSYNSSINVLVQMENDF